MNIKEKQEMPYINKQDRRVTAPLKLGQIGTFSSDFFRSEQKVRRQIIGDVKDYEAQETVRMKTMEVVREM